MIARGDSNLRVRHGGALNAFEWRRCRVVVVVDGGKKRKRAATRSHGTFPHGRKHGRLVHLSDVVEELRQCAPGDAVVLAGPERRAHRVVGLSIECLHRDHLDEVECIGAHGLVRRIVAGEEHMVRGVRDGVPAWQPCAVERRNRRAHTRREDRGWIRRGHHRVRGRMAFGSVRLGPWQPSARRVPPENGYTLQRNRSLDAGGREESR